MQNLLDQDYTHVACIRLVQDNLNTHTPGSFYEVLPPGDALLHTALASSREGILMATSKGAKPLPIPRLEAGDCLDQVTFHERYQAMPSDFRAELIGGMVLVPSPLSSEHGQYHALIMGWLTKTTGIFTSTVFPGLWLHRAALCQLDVPQVMATLRQGLASPEHAAFVQQLQSRREASP